MTSCSRIALLWCCVGCLTGSTRAAPATLPAAGLRDQQAGAKGLDSAVNRLHAAARQTDPLPAAEAQRHFKVADGLAVDLIAAEPTVRQPLNINFDARGRMWVTQYIQYPFPAGLKVAEYDQYLRAKYDKVPPPPPKRNVGHDRITILESTRGPGSYDKATVFLDGLDLATSALPDRDGVWVMNPPYLLFYSDKNHDDVPDGDPQVHLSGFGIEDTHAVANSLTWGPDGWIYGCQGSTCTAKVKVEITGEAKTTDFLGQAIWRYHPTQHRFEIFAEGGGNSFGIEFDDAGRCFSGTNWGKYRGLYFVQGGYYVKNWAKHGPLTNPYAFGYLEHMPHDGDATRLVHTFVIYGGGLLGKPYDGKILGVNALQSRVQVTRLVPDGSSFRTVEEPNLLTTDDGWFRPVDIKTGPDGALYIADFYERRITHLDPRDTWDRSNGRIWRVRPKAWEPAAVPDFARLDGPQIVEELADKNRWVRWEAVRELQSRVDAPPTRESVLAPHAADRAAYQRREDVLRTLEAALAENEPRIDFDFWRALHACGSGSYFADRSASIRAFHVLADAAQAPPVEPSGSNWLTEMGCRESDPLVRSTLASVAKRLPAAAALPLIAQMLSRDEDAKDPLIPMLLWWAVEDKAVSARDQVVALFSNARWQWLIVRETIMPRLARRYAADPTPENQRALVKLIAGAPGEAERAILFGGVAQAFEGSQIHGLLPELEAVLAASGNREIALRAGDKAAHDEAVRAILDEDPKARDKRLKLIEVLGQVGRPEAVPALLKVAEGSPSHAVRKAALAALRRFDDPAIGPRVVAIYPKLPTEQNVRQAAINLLVSREAWASALMDALGSGAVPRAELPTDAIDRLRSYDAVAARAEKLFGPARHASSEEMASEIERVKAVVSAEGAGDATAGRAIFAQRCAVCHTLFNEGAKLGPDLTGYDRKNLDFLALSIVDPSAAIREEYTTFRIRTRDKQTFVGLITDRGTSQVTLVDSAQQKTVIAKDQIVDERALPISLMPEGLLADLPEQPLRDLFAYLMRERAPGRK